MGWNSGYRKEKNMDEERYSGDGKIHDSQRLKELQALPLWRKIQITQARIMEWYNFYEGQVSISFSGGKDSTVLLDLARRIYPDIEAVFVDTGLEYSQIRNFVKTFDNVTWLKPEMRFNEVIKKYGYPLGSKRIALYIEYGRKALERGDIKQYKKYVEGLIENSDGTTYTYMPLSKIMKKLFDSDIKVSSKCCGIMKEKPLNNYAKLTKKKPITAIMASESNRRKNAWIKTGCNAFDGINSISKPMSFWTENDVLEYINTYKIPYASVYGDIIKNENEKYLTTGENRTGCVFCGFGCHLEKSPNRFERLKKIDKPKWEYCMRSIEENGLGMGAVLDYINVPYGKEDKD